MSKRKLKSTGASQTASPVTEAGGDPFCDRIEAQRQRLFHAMAIVDVCALATTSLEAMDDPERLADALRAAYELLNDAAGNLERIAHRYKTEAPR